MAEVNMSLQINRDLDANVEPTFIMHEGVKIAFSDYKNKIISSQINLAWLGNFNNNRHNILLHILKMGDNWKFEPNRKALVRLLSTHSAVLTYNIDYYTSKKYSSSHCMTA